MWFVRAVSVPTSGVLYSLHAIMGMYATALTDYDVGALCAVFCGLVLYNAPALWTTARRVFLGMPVARGGKRDGYGAVVEG